MTGPNNALVLEILRQDNALAMSIFEQKEQVSTIKQYSQCSVSFAEINKLCQEVLLILNKANKQYRAKSELIHNLEKAGQVLWDHLFTRAVKDKLRNTVIKDLILSLDEELINIPWELMYDGANFLCLKFSLGRLVRSRGQVNPPQYRSLTSELKMLVLANPTGDLKSAYIEGKYIKDNFDRKGSALKIDFKSTHIDTLYVKKNLRDYDIVHFAGHCEYEADNPESSGWVLSDGRFTTSDISALGDSLRLPNLIFSNACYSAQSPRDLMKVDYQEKTYSLAAAFLFSGVRHYIGAIWKIEDPVSLVFAKEFYSNLLSGKSVGECVRLGRLKLVKEYGLASLFWSSYLLYGDPNFILLKKSRDSDFGLKRNIFRKPLIKISLVLIFISLISASFLTLLIGPRSYISFSFADRLFSQGKNQEAIAIVKKILDRNPSFLPAYPLLANTYKRLGDRANALKYYFEYALNSEKRHDKKNMASAYIGIGWIYQSSGEYTKALDFYNKAILLSKDSRSKLTEASSLRRLAVWHIDKGEYDLALELLTKSSEINRERQDINEYKYNLACDYFDIGLVFANKGDFPAAKEFYNKAKLLFEKLELKNELSDYYFNLGEICLFEKQYQKAHDYYLKGLSIDEREANMPNMAIDYDMIGKLYAEMGNLEKAEDFFNKAVETSRQINAIPRLASSYNNLGLLYKQKGMKSEAREYFLKARELYQSIDTPDYQKVKDEISGLGERE